MYKLVSQEAEQSGAGRTYSVIMSFFIVLSLVPLCFHEDSPVFSVIEYVCVSAFIVDYAIRWATADYNLKRGVASFVIYPFTPMAIIDLLTILPCFIALNPSFKALRILRLLRALSALKLIRYSKGVDALKRAAVNQREQLAVVAAIAAAYVVICALVMFNVEPDTFPTFFSALYWAVVSLTTVGYGDLYPTSDIGRGLAMVSSIVGIAIVAMPSGIITAGLIDELDKQKAK